MQPADDPNVDYRLLVQQGYNACAAAYDQARQREGEPLLALLTDQLQDGATILDLGCGAGVPVARTLAERFVVTGVDLAPEQIRLARQQVPAATFIQGDMLTVALPPAHFDAVVAFYSIFHLPREEHPRLLERIYGWLKPGGFLLVTVADQAEEAYTQDDFFGVTMYWSNYGLGDYHQMLEQLGFTIQATCILGHGYDPETQLPTEEHPLILAQKAPPPTSDQ